MINKEKGVAFVSILKAIKSYGKIEDLKKIASILTSGQDDSEDRRESREDLRLEIVQQI